MRRQPPTFILCFEVGLPGSGTTSIISASMMRPLTSTCNWSNIHDSKLTMVKKLCLLAVFSIKKFWIATTTDSKSFSFFMFNGVKIGAHLKSTNLKVEYVYRFESGICVTPDIDCGKWTEKYPYRNIEPLNEAQREGEPHVSFTMSSSKILIFAWNPMYISALLFSLQTNSRRKACWIRSKALRWPWKSGYLLSIVVDRPNCKIWLHPTDGGLWT